MSEYQYYEFQAIDHRLTAKEQAEVKKLSSRVQLSPTQATFVYNYGDFPGDPEQVLTRYFDVMFYIANWGTWQLLFRLPKAIADAVKTKRQQQEQKAARKKRIQELEALAPKEASIWKRVVEPIDLKQARSYDEATALLQDLRDLADHQERLPEFGQRFENIRSMYENRPALIRRFKAIKL